MQPNQAGILEVNFAENRLKEGPKFMKPKLHHIRLKLMFISFEMKVSWGTSQLFPFLPLIYACKISEWPYFKQLED